MTKENLVKSPERRKKRTPIGVRNVLNVKGKDPAYVYRVVNVTKDRVEDLLEQDWEIDTSDQISVGDSSLKQIGKLGTARELSVGGGVKAIVMRKRKEWHEEDQAEKLANVQKIEDATRQKALDGTYGKLEITRS